jgi:hypothetical protein
LIVHACCRREEQYFNAPIGRPILPDLDSSARSALLLTWLDWCDKSHNCNRNRVGLGTGLPTRLLHVGPLKELGHNADRVRLIHISEATSQRYVALSHCWGQLPEEEQRRFCTTPSNLDRRLQGFNVSELSKTFQDAVIVTRELGIDYLWIDSLCIIQYEDSGEDWKYESTRMETVFSQAYCTIAATAATHINAGFLKRDTRIDDIYVKDTSGNEFYVSNDIDDFDEDVDRARLNSRAWVMQETVLARRTIHFSNKQMYWECGGGIFCENLTRLTRYELCRTLAKEHLNNILVAAPSQTGTSRSIQIFRSGSSNVVPHVH